MAEINADWNRLADQLRLACKKAGGTWIHPRHEHVDATALGVAFVPEVLIKWLKLCGGATVGRLTLLGVHKTSQSPSIHEIVEADWSLNQYLPIAMDDFGSYYALKLNGKAVVFVDEDDVDSVQYAVASGLAAFLQLVMAAVSQDREEWESDKEFVVSIDPEILNVKDEPLSWDVLDS